MGAAARAIVLFTWVAGAIACGPIEYIHQVTRTASADVASARAAVHARDAYARYWLTLAIEYLNKARVEASYADFEAATSFGRKATRAARKARAIARHNAADPEDMVRIVDVDADADDELERGGPGEDDAP